MTEIYPFILTLLSALVFPGLLFIVALALFTEWYIRKAVAHMQSRMGPTYVGPIGLLQPLADLLKLLSVKEEMKQKYSMTWLAKAFGVIGIGAMIACLFLLPLSPVRFIGDYDFLIFIYLFGIWVPISIIVMALSIPNPFAHLGVSRLLTFIIVTEPAYFAGLLVPITFASIEAKPVYSIYATSIKAISLWSNPYYIPFMIIALIAVIASIQAKAMLNPFNIPEAEQELIAGFATEFSGPVLAIYNLLHDVDVAISALFVTYVFLGGPLPFNHLSIPGIILLIIKYIAVVTIVSVIRSSFGRYRIDQAIRVLTKYSLILALIAVIAANIMVYVFH